MIFKSQIIVKIVVSKNKNCMNVDIETPTTEQTCQDDSKVSEHNFYITNDVLDNLEGLVS